MKEYARPSDNEATRLQQAETRLRLVPPPLPAGELFSDYVVRAVMGDAIFKPLAAQCLRYSLPATIPWVFRPATITRYAAGLVHGEWGPQFKYTDEERFQRFFDRLWFRPNPEDEPLSIKMLSVPRISLDDFSDEKHEPPPETVRRLELYRAFTMRRDFLFADLCEALRDGSFIARGFLAIDHARREVEIASGWWSDHTVKCAWRHSELKPIEHAPAGTPYFRGIRLFSSTSSRTSNEAAATSPETPEAWFLRRKSEFAAAPRHPSLEADWAAAKDAFPGIARKVIELLREQYIPKSRLKQGRRPKKSPNPPRKSPREI